MRPVVRRLCDSVALLAVFLGACDAASRGRRNNDGSTYAAAPAAGRRSTTAVAFSGTDPFGIAIGDARVWLDSSSLRDAARALGVSDHITRYEADSAITVFCVRTTEPTPEYVVLDGTGTDTDHVTEVFVSREAPLDQQVRDACQPLPPGKVAIATPVGLRLGMNWAEATRILPKPTYVSYDDVAEYTLGDSLRPGEVSRAGSGNARVDHRVGVILHVRQGVVVAVTLDRNNGSFESPVE